jgi:hypothetical protein
MPYSPFIGSDHSHRWIAQQGVPTMAKTKFNLPKDGAVEPEGARISAEDDVEGHGLPITVPSLGSKVPGHGGENIPMPIEDDDVEGHRRRD